MQQMKTMYATKAMKANLNAPNNVGVMGEDQQLFTRLSTPNANLEMIKFD